MLECHSCSTLNPNGEAACLSCGTSLQSVQATGISGASGATGRCAAGHPVDPSWKTCPYCSQPGGTAGSGGRTRLDEAPPAAVKRTRLEPAEPASGAGGNLLPGAGARPRPLPAGGAKPTVLDEPEPSRGRPTVLHEAGVDPASAPVARGAAGPPPATVQPAAAQADPAAAPAAAPVRRLVGVLAGPELGAGGAVFAVRSGRNTLGADRVSDVVLDADGEVSREHAVILHRNGTFHLADRLSTNGTWVNGEEVPANGTVPLADRDRIRLGRTELVFLRLDLASTSSTD